MLVGSSTVALTIVLIISLKGFFLYLIVHSYILITAPAGLHDGGEKTKQNQKAEVFLIQLSNPAINPECHFVILLYCIIPSHAFSL